MATKMIHNIHIAFNSLFVTILQVSHLTWECWKFENWMLLGQDGLDTLNVQETEHAPAPWRINTVFSNQKGFSEDFDCPLGSKLNPTKRCIVWWWIRWFFFIFICFFQQFYFPAKDSLTDWLTVSHLANFLSSKTKINFDTIL